MGGRRLALVLLLAILLVAAACYVYGPARHFEPAVHVKFDYTPVVLRTAASGPAVAIRAGVCTVGLRAFVGSPDPVIRAVVQVVGKSATIEPSYGCGVLAPGAAGDRSRYWTVRLPRGLPQWRLFALRDALRAIRPGVETAEPVPKARPSQANTFLGADDSDDHSGPYARYGTQWYLHACKVPEAWRALTWPLAANAPVVAAVDFGFLMDHDELHGVFNRTEAWNSCDETAEVGWGTQIGHGTGTVGLLAARQDDNAGLTGVFPGGEVWPIQADCETPVSGDPWAKAVYRVRDRSAAGRKIIQLEVEASDGRSYETNLALHDAIKDVVEHDNIVVVIAAGNGRKDAGKNAKGEDIVETGSIVVGATRYNPKGSRWGKSNYGPRIVVSAPGDPDRDLTLSADASDPYRSDFGGTSGATAKVAGAVALLLTCDDLLTPLTIKTYLGTSGTLVDSDPLMPVGHNLDALEALKKAGCAPPP